MISFKDVEERLWIIIPWALEIETSGKKIAGRYPTEAILEMKAGDILSVNKGGCAKTETYMVVQAGNELFLVKKKTIIIKKFTFKIIIYKTTILIITYFYATIK